MFALELKVQAFASIDSAGRKSYTKGQVLKWDVEYGSMTLDLLLKSLTTELNLGTNQEPTVWFYDKRLNEDCRLVDEVQMVDFFEMYKEEMTCQVVVGVFDREEIFFASLETICVVPPGADAQVEPEAQPEAAGSMPKEPNANEPPINVDDIEPDREPSMFDNPEEYVGINDEGMYGSVPPAPEFAQPSYNANKEPPPKFVNVEAEVDDDDPLEIHVLHDPENPKIAEGEFFPDIKTFRKAIRHFAVKSGFAFAPGVRTAKARFIAKCAAKGCPWRIHSSTIWDKKTIHVPSVSSVSIVNKSCFMND
jgi:hypothetical protein